tara:strand:- start:782 stop:1267 length:486 start_codon:yes stop_codon:yes gene_type:complete
MFGLITMLLSTLGATGMGSMLKIIGGLVQSASEAKEQKAKRELARDLAMANSNAAFQKAVFGEATDKESSLFTRATRRLIALIGMLNFATISILCTVYPDVDLVTFVPPEQFKELNIFWGFFKMPLDSGVTTSITTGHIALVSITTLGAIIGFYFTPGGKR